MNGDQVTEIICQIINIGGLYLAYFLGFKQGAQITKEAIARKLDRESQMPESG
jgi:hypothetical protein